MARSENTRYDEDIERYMREDEMSMEDATIRAIKSDADVLVYHPDYGRTEVLAYAHKYDLVAWLGYFRHDVDPDDDEIREIVNLAITGCGAVEAEAWQSVIDDAVNGVLTLGRVRCNGLILNVVLDDDEEEYLFNNPP